MLLKCCTQYVSKFRKLISGHRTGSRQFSFQSQRRVMSKKCSKYCTSVLFLHASKVVLKIFQARLQQVIQELSEYKMNFKEAEEPEIKLSTFVGSWQKQGSSRKTSIPASLTMIQTDCVDHNQVWKITRDGSTRPLYLSPEKPVCRSRSNS